MDLMSTGPTWSKHYHSYWEGLSGDPQLPKWLRIVAVAYAMHKPNGHAMFRKGTRSEPGHLAVMLGEVDPVTGEFTIATRHVVNDNIDKAVEFGMLAKGSHSGCLIVPAHGIVNGYGAVKLCPVDHLQACRKHERKAKAVSPQTPLSPITVSPAPHAGVPQDTVISAEVNESGASVNAPSISSSGLFEREERAPCSAACGGRMHVVTQGRSEGRAPINSIVAALLPSSGRRLACAGLRSHRSAAVA